MELTKVLVYTAISLLAIHVVNINYPILDLVTSKFNCLSFFLSLQKVTFGSDSFAHDIHREIRKILLKDKNSKNISENDIRKSIHDLYKLLGTYAFEQQCKPFSEIEDEMEYDYLLDEDFENEENWKDYLSELHQVDNKHYNAIYSSMKHMFKVCDKLKVKCFLGMGSLLGSWRHHGIIQWDNDGDLIMTVKGNNKENITKLTKDLKNDMSENMDYLFNEVEPGWFGLKKLKSHTLKSEEDNHVNIWLFVDNTTHISSVNDKYSHLSFDKKDVFPLHKRPFGRSKLYAPHNTYSIVKQMYPDILSEKDCQKVPCSDVKDDYGFVYRVPLKDLMFEVVVMQTYFLNFAITKEPIDTAVVPFKT